MKYLLLIYNCEPPEPGDPGFAEAVARVNAFADECRARGALVAADKVAAEHTATTVSVREGRTIVTDGPFVETHEHLGGFYVLDCADLDEALELAALCPFAELGTIEVRPLVVVPGVDHRVAVRPVDRAAGAG
ncbi:MAG TPA: YciI family protein [Actinophytocola sp.]|uniref:YciI family protein n=1 Tax=Actinophytocola sp. TaxID=1872138 RepID=UPI002DB97617|nr:YciI family protein [Actinophytocola sp.]HEU5475639.1 YciI family protein [Actinophytocola sp.]